METRLLFVRHGESVHKTAGVVGGPNGCQGLTEAGHGQARLLAERLREEVAGPVAVYSSVLRRAVETAEPIAAAFAAVPEQHCGLCTWHTPSYADGMPMREFHAAHGVPGGGVFRPSQEGNETWAELIARTGRAILDIAHLRRGGTAILVGHAETVESSFHALAARPLDRAFDLAVAPASVTEWTTGGDPTAWPAPRWTLHRCNDVR
ncbi:histidine phosphatase family protein [Dactylosporangium maewongense]|uniref:Histidine phosphatase family protein n=1 Tax=Dactylosporangium maewongense TaxID=634393 RepID=A0ABP4MGK1_9ACTN